MLLLEARLDRLLGRLERGGVIPLLGAGVSQGAEAPPGFDPSLGWMAGRLRDRLRTHWEEEGDPGGRYGLDTILANPEKRGNSLPFDRLAEVFRWIFDQRILCKTLQIDRFTELAPTKAHRYIALLVREGLITEIITTNYDCCIEKALQSSFPVGSSDRHHCCEVISSLKGYRDRGGQRRFDGEGCRRRPVLRLYKFNGCAADHRRNPQDQADHILLTEGQLQSYRDNPWKQDLLRDRCRTHNFLLSGFGSEEPQVQHLLMQLQGEFSHIAHHYSSVQEILALPNAPFVAGYGKEVNFRHRQLLESFLRAHGHGDKYPRDCNIFTGKDGNHLIERTDGCLPADLFWERVYQGAFKRLMLGQLRPGTRFHGWLSHVSDHPGAWCHFLRACLYPPLSHPPEKSNPPNPQWLDHQFGRYRFLLAYPSRRHDRPIRLMTLLRLMQGRPGLIEEEGNWYLPMREYGITIPALLLLLCLLGKIEEEDFSFLDCNHEVGRNGPSGGIRLVISAPEGPYDGGSPSWAHRSRIEIYLGHRELDQAPPRFDHRPEGRLVFRIFIPGIDTQPVERRWQFLQRSANGREPGVIRFGRTIHVSFADLLAELGTVPTTGSHTGQDKPACREQRMIAALLSVSRTARATRARGRLRPVRRNGNDR